MWNRKEQVKSKAIITLQCVLSSDQLTKVSPFHNGRDYELWEKLIELYEGTGDSRIGKLDLLINQLQNCGMRDGVSISQLHSRFKELLNSFHFIRENVEN